MQFSFIIVQSVVLYFSCKGINYVSALILYCVIFKKATYAPHIAVLLHDPCHIKLYLGISFIEHYITAGFEVQFHVHIIGSG